MSMGILWFDNEKGLDLLAKVNRAARHYHKKYGCKATLCYVHPSMLDDLPPHTGNGKSIQAEGVELRTWNMVMPDHFWITRNGVIE